MQVPRSSIFPSLPLSGLRENSEKLSYYHIIHYQKPRAPGVLLSLCCSFSVSSHGSFYSSDLKKIKPRFYLMFSFPRAQSLPIHGFFNGADDSPAFMSRAHLHPHSPLPTRWLHSDVPKTHKEYEIPLSLTLTPQCSCSLCSLVHKRQSHLYSYLSQKLWAPSDP